MSGGSYNSCPVGMFLKDNCWQLGKTKQKKSYRTLRFFVTVFNLLAPEFDI
jgi:hypothetical protein